MNHWMNFVVLPFFKLNLKSGYHLFRPFLRKFVLVFFDDILIYCTNEQDHIIRVANVLQTLNVLLGCVRSPIWVV